MRVLPCVLTVLLVLGSSRPGHADDPREVAFGHYERGLDLVQKQDYQGALREFTAAYDISPHFAVLYNIGQCQVRLGRLPEAVDALSRYLGDGRYLVPADRRRQVGDQVAELSARLNPPPPTTDRALEKAAQDAAEAAERAGEEASRAAKVAHAAAVAARVAAAAVRASGSKPRTPATSVPVAAQGTKR
jgi:hypothetical protein